MERFRENHQMVHGWHSLIKQKKIKMFLIEKKVAPEL